MRVKTALLLFLVPALFVMFGMGSCVEEPAIFIEEPADGAVIGTETVAFTISYTNADAATLEVLLDGSDITGSFSVGADFATASIVLADGDYDLVASISGDGGDASTSSTFTVDAVVAPVPATIELFSGDGQSGTVGATLADDLIALVTDQYGDPYGGALVNFSTDAGSVNPASALTAADGTAGTALTLPTAPGAVTVTARLDATGGTVDFGATALTGPAANLTIYSGNNQSGDVGETLPDPLVVQLADTYGNPVQGDEVTFSSADGSVDPASALTDASGLAQTEYTLGAGLGVQNVSATADTTALATVIFTINAGYTPQLDSLSLSVPSPVSADVGSTTATATALDQYGNPMTGLAVAISSTIGTAGLVNDNGDGTYSADITGLTTAGSGTVTASSGGLNDGQPLEVTAGAAAILDLSVPATVDASIGEATALVTLTDAQGNGLAGVSGTITSTIGSVGTISDLGGGSYSALITGLTTPQQTADVEASFAGLTDSGSIQILGTGTPDSLVLSCDDTAGADDGTASCTLVIEDEFGQGIEGLSVDSSSACATAGSVSDDGGGNYSFGVSGLRTAGGCDVTATFDTLSDTETITVEAGATASAALSVGSPVSADVAETTASVAFEDAWGNAKSGLTVSVTSGSGSVGAVSEGPAGTYSASITGLTTAGSYTVEASADGVSDDAPLVVTAGAPASLNLSCATPISADDGESSCSAAVADQYGNPNEGETITPSSDCGAGFTAVSDNGGGDYGFAANGLRTAGTCDVTAAAGAATDTDTVAINAGATASAVLSVGSPVSADVGETTASASFEDAWGNAKSGLTVSITSGSGTVGAVSESPAGTYSASITGLTAAGSYTVEASADGVSDDATLVVTAGDPANVGLSCATPISADDGESACSTSVSDQYGNPNTGEAVAPSSDCGAGFTSVSDNGGGDYGFAANGLRTAGTCDITASVDTEAAAIVSDTFTVTINAGVATSATLSVAGPVSADTGSTTASMSFSDAYGNAKDGLTVNLTSTSGTPGSVSDLGGGDYEATISGLRTAGTFSATASAQSASDTDSFTVTAGAASGMSVSATSPVNADGTTPSDVTAALTDAWGNPIAGATVSITSTLGSVTSVNDEGGGTYTAQVTSSTAGTATVTATSGAASDSTTVEFICFEAPDMNGGTNGCLIDGLIEVTVIDGVYGTPIQNALVQVGIAPDDPFVGNYDYTDVNGVVTFEDASLSGPTTVTAGVPGSADYAFFTLAEVDANRIVIPLGYQSRTNVPTSDLSGDVGGWSISNGDNWWDFGLVAPTLTIDNLLNLDLDNLLAPNVGRQAVGPFGITIDVDVPGNVYAPEQTERINYGLNINVTLDFTPYVQVPVETYTFNNVFCLAGRSPDQETVDILDGGGELTDLFGLLEFHSAGLSSQFYVNGNMTVPNFNLGNSLSSNLTVNTANTPAGTELYVASIADIDSLGGTGRLVPMGFAALVGGSPTNSTLTTINAGGSIPSYTTIVGAAALATTGSGVATQVQRTGLAPGGTSNLNSFFNIISGMSQATTSFGFTSPENGVSPAMDLQRSAVIREFGGSDIAYYEWDVLAPFESFELPELPTGVYPLTDPLGTPDDDILRWEASGYGLTLNGSFNFDGFAFDDIDEWITHFTYNKVTASYPY